MQNGISGVSLPADPFARRPVIAPAPIQCGRQFIAGPVHGCSDRPCGGGNPFFGSRRRLFQIAQKFVHRVAHKFVRLLKMNLSYPPIRWFAMGCNTTRCAPDLIDGFAVIPSPALRNVRRRSFQVDRSVKQGLHSAAQQPKHSGGAFPSPFLSSGGMPPLLGSNSPESAPHPPGISLPPSRMSQRATPPQSQYPGQCLRGACRRRGT